MSGISASAFLMGGGGAPAAKFPAPGSSVSGVIVDEPVIMQQKDFTTGAPLTWPSGEAKLQLVVTIKTASGDQRLFIKSQLKTAVAQAVKAAGKSSLEVGGTLTVTFVGVGEPARPGLSGAKQYEATYAAPVGAQAAVLGTGQVGLPVPVPGQPGAENPFLNGGQPVTPVVAVNPQAFAQALSG